jgi:hypothetical protein
MTVNVYNIYYINMTNKDWEIVWESDFKIVDKDELEKMKEKWDLNKKIDLKADSEDNWKEEKWWNLKDDLINLWFLDYDNLSEKEKIIFDEMKDEKRDEFYKLD